VLVTRVVTAHSQIGYRKGEAFNSFSFLGNLVEPTGIEPVTSAVRLLRSPN
jgi:hypothetical protein